jgi:nitroimidazol reductase NimA-like FMN-containing flavoprotein (pyridoxamine 5'-phosphate oxidase superfamily)
MLKYHMHKSEREIKNREEIEEIVSGGKYVTLSLCRADEPYIVTLNYGYDRARGAFYFHTALKGLKLEFMEANPRVCGTVVEDRGYLADRCDHAYRSVILYGTLRRIMDVEEKKYGMQVMLSHLEERPEEVKRRLLKDESRYGKVEILRLDISNMTGKQAH